MSIESEMLKLLMRAGSAKWDFSSPLAMQHYVKVRRPVLERKPQDYLSPWFQVMVEEIAGFPVYRIKPKDSDPTRELLYLHGGSYVSPIKGLHWGFIRRLISTTPCQVTVPLYGLAPRFNHRDALHLLREVYQNLLMRNAPADVIFMGDSCGGALSLGFAQTLRDSGKPLPGALVLLSPWLDITLSNPAIAPLESRDPLLAVPGSREAGKMWTAGADPHLPFLSPIFGGLRGLPPILAMIGTDDILSPDVRVLRDKAAKENCALIYREYPGMFHNWMLSPIPEGRRAVREIVEFMEQLPKQGKVIKQA